MRKRIFISTIYLELGGIERSLMGLLNAIDYSQYEVDLFLYRHGGDLFDAIPSQVNLLPENKAYSSLYCSVLHAFKQGYSGVAIAKILAKLHSKIFYGSRKSTLENYSQPHYMHKYAAWFLPPLMPAIHYDLAIGFVGPFHILRDKVSARRKVGWIHTDYSTIEINAEEEFPVWNSLDSIASISDDVTTAFLKVFPDLASNIILIENILSPEEVRRQAKAELMVDEFDQDDGRIKLLSIGRFCTAKNFDNVPAICRRLVESGMPVVWYLLGYGSDEALIAKNIHVEGMDSHVILLGKKKNPYPYIRHCDIYVQPSRYEGKAVTVREAQILSKPVIVTSYPTSASQVRHGVDGVIVPMDNAGIAEGINGLVNDPELRARLVENLRHNDYGNEVEIHKIYQLCDFG